MDKATQYAFEAFMGRDPDPTGANRRILRLAPTVPGCPFEFEWHPQSRKLYFHRLSSVEGGEAPGEIKRHWEIIAEHVEHHAMAYGFVQTFCRGWREGLNPDIPKFHLAG